MQFLANRYNSRPIQTECNNRGTSGWRQTLELEFIINTKVLGPSILTGIKQNDRQLAFRVEVAPGYVGSLATF